MMQQTRPAYELRNIRHGYGQEFVLDVPELTVEKGISLGLVGPNGCGKSTLLRLLAFLEEPNSGDIRFEEMTAGADYASLRKQVTLVLQEPYLLKRSVFDNVAYGLRVRGEKEGIKKRVFEALEWVGLEPETFAYRRWFELSGGEAQRVSVASRLILRPKVLLLDEPTASVDTRSAALIQKAILDIRGRWGTTLVIASHDLTWLNGITDEILRIHSGRIVGSGVENVLTGPWIFNGKDLWTKQMGDTARIFATRPPDENSVAILHPEDIMIAIEEPASISAQNILRGTITYMTTSRQKDKVQVMVQTSTLSLTCSITHYAVSSLGLLPGKDVFVIFKAASLMWQ
ncbi:MAG TPA: ATP-binding cassette domain-containing protein [Deltaproteobacteria bacterium]|nr:ATP-binding cassette domain-containing protein [Deltaproteobacteria bacterium]